MALELVKASCPSCGGKLTIGTKLARGSCQYCGSEFVVERAGGVVSLSLEAGIERIGQGVDRTASELAITRLKEEIQREENDIAVTQMDIDRRSVDLLRRPIYVAVTLLVTGVLIALTIASAVYGFTCFLIMGILMTLAWGLFSVAAVTSKLSEKQWLDSLQEQQRMARARVSSLRMEMDQHRRTVSGR